MVGNLALGKDFLLVFVFPPIFGIGPPVLHTRLHLTIILPE